MGRLVLVVAILVFCCCLTRGLEVEQRDLDYMGWWMGVPGSQFAGESAFENGNPSIEVISSQGPRAFLYHNFLSAAETDHLISLAEGRFRNSKVVNSAGFSVARSARTSSDHSIRRGQDAVVAGIEQRIADWTGAPVDHGEGMQVLRYELGEHYAPHHDFFYEERSILDGGQRIATVILYLTDGYKGGETAFPDSTPTSGSQTQDLSECARRGVAVKASKGDALLFFSVSPDGNSMDVLSLHTSCPVLEGTKYVATKWLRSDFVKDL